MLPRGSAWVSENYIPRRDERRPKRDQRATTRRHVALGSGRAPECPKEKREETKKIWCQEVALYQSCESRKLIRKVERFHRRTVTSLTPLERYELLFHPQAAEWVNSYLSKCINYDEYILMKIRKSKKECYVRLYCLMAYHLRGLSNAKAIHVDELTILAPDDRMSNVHQRGWLWH